MSATRFSVAQSEEWTTRWLWEVHDATRSRIVARCDTQADAANVCSALNARESEAQHALAIDCPGGENCYCR